MPCTLPEWLTKPANAITRTLGRVTTGPTLRALLERAGDWAASPTVSGDLPDDDADKLMLALYWVSEYYQRRLSPADLLVVLRNLLT